MSTTATQKNVTVGNIVSFITAENNNLSIGIGGILSNKFNIEKVANFKNIRNPIKGC